MFTSSLKNRRRFIWQAQLTLQGQKCHGIDPELRLVIVQLKHYIGREEVKAHCLPSFEAGRELTGGRFDTLGTPEKQQQKHDVNAILNGNED